MVKPNDVNKLGSEQGMRKANFVSGPGRQDFQSTKPTNGKVEIQSTPTDNTPVNMGYASGPVERGERADQLVEMAGSYDRTMSPESRFGKMKG